MSKNKGKTAEELLQEALVPVEEHPYPIPENWVWVKLGSLITVKSGDGLTRNQMIDGPHPVYGGNGVNGFHKENNISEPSIIVGRVGFNCGSVHLSENYSWVTDNAFIVSFDKTKIDIIYLYWLLKNLNLGQYSKSTAQPVISGKTIYPIMFPLPPLKEQKRIADKVERLLSKLEQAKELVVQTMENIDLNRKSVIVNAYLGKLTEEWRRTNQINESAFDLVMEIQKRRKIDYLSNVELIKATSSLIKNKSESDFIPYISHEDSSLPKNWCITRILDLTECLDRFRKPVSKAERENRPGNIPYYGANGQVDTINDYIFNDDIVLVVEDETFTGREKPFSYIVRGKSWVNNHAHVLRPLGGIDVEYLNICLSYYNFIPLTSGSTGRRKLTQAALNQAPLRLAPLSEQKIIVSKVRKVHDVLDKVKQNCIITLERIECNKKSILNKAFKGELGTYDHGEVKAIDLLIEKEIGLNYRGR
ncbi:restriction endonuclease subunit S [Paenibacillus sp. FSL R5-0636]|uniref:restriction endonuclease subunit S n=1 Tax=Paenibacillus TaxID=44249 RepID=UPI00096D4B50|nr:restriction endonuclease subunit S [Paenibacillus odorifer]OMC95716.1 hypothetical protein BJP49_12885 [Paenibacillus odorifer]